MPALNDYPQTKYSYEDIIDCPHCRTEQSMLLTHAWSPSLAPEQMKCGYQCTKCLNRLWKTYDMPELRRDPTRFEPEKFSQGPVVIDRRHTFNMKCKKCGDKAHELWAEGRELWCKKCMKNHGRRVN